MALLRALSMLALGGLAAEAQHLGLSYLRILYFTPGTNCTGAPLGNTTLPYLPPKQCVNSGRIDGCISLASGPVIEITPGCEANCSICKGNTTRIGPQSCFPDPSGGNALVMYTSYTCAATFPPGMPGGNGTGGNGTGGNGTGEGGYDTRDAVCMPFRAKWDAIGCMTFLTQRCNGADLRFAETACGSQYPCKASIYPSAAQKLNTSNCAQYCKMHDLQCVAAWYPGPSGESCDLGSGARVQNASCGSNFSFGQGVPPTCECGGYASMQSGPTALERSIAPECLSQLGGFYQCMDQFRNSDPTYYYERLPPQQLRERVVWAMGTTAAPTCAFISSRLAQRLGAEPCPSGMR